MWLILLGSLLALGSILYDLVRTKIVVRNNSGDFEDDTNNNVLPSIEIDDNMLSNFRLFVEEEEKLFQRSRRCNRIKEWITFSSKLIGALTALAGVIIELLK
jgi:hypothetical protein